MGTNTLLPESTVDALPRAVRELLRKRGLIDSAAVDAFLKPDYETGLANPFLMTDMDKAVDRILLAAKKGERVAIFGDYDIDGITSTTLMLETLKWQGIEATTYIPDRYAEGYGINIPALEKLKAEGVGSGGLG